MEITNMRTGPMIALMLLITTALSGHPVAAQSTPAKPVQIDGSTTMILFGQNCGNLYKLESNVEVTVRGGGTANGFKLQSEGKVDIVQNDRPITGHANGIP